jgi:hypothetical protein
VNGGIGWQWYYSGDPIAGADSASLIATQTGAYFAMITGSHGCTWSTDTVVVVLTVGMMEMQDEGMGPWPNPTADVVYFQNHHTNTLQGRLQNATGRSIREVRLSPGRNVIDLTGLGPGIYLLLMPDGEAHRIVKM